MRYNFGSEFAALVAVAVLGASPAIAQTGRWTPPRAADGHVDLQGIWANNTATPLERPDSLADKETFTDEELARLRESAQRLFGGADDAAFADGVFNAVLAALDTNVSRDGGGRWESLRLDLPVVPMYDLQIKDGHLVAGTHGRSFWILDDLSPLRELTEDALSAPAHLVKPRRYTRLLQQAGSIMDETIGMQYMSDVLGPPVTYRQVGTPGGGRKRIYLTAGANPPDGVSIFYHLANEPEGETSLTLRAPSGAAIRTYSTSSEGEDRLDARQGMNRSQWDTRYPLGRELDDKAGGNSPFGAKNTGPLAPPGAYTVELSTGGTTLKATFEIAADPRSDASQEDLDAQFALQIAIRDRYTEAQGQVVRIRSLRDQVQQWAARAKGHAAEATLTEAADAITAKLGDVENSLVPFRSAGPQPRGIPLGLYAKLKELMGVVASADWPPTKPSRDVFASLNERLNAQADDLQRIVDEDVAAFAELIAEHDIPEIVP